MKTDPQDTAENASPTPPLLAAALLLAALLWAYWPALAEMVAAWGKDPDYSHGYLVVPLALGYLWLQRDRLDRRQLGPNWRGLFLLVLVVAIRYFTAAYYLGPVDAWTLPLSIAGVVLLVFGWPCLAWSWPSILFLYFMIPIPYSAETWLSVPLQSVATRLSTEALQLLGQPAIAEGNVIWMADYPLHVAEACSGLRILFGIFALAFAYVLFTSWAWWQKALVLAATVPVALGANMLRIVATGLLHRLVSGEAAHRFSHDLAGLVMIPVAAAMFWLLLVYLEHLFPRTEVLSPAAAVNAAGRQR